MYKKIITTIALLFVLASTFGVAKAAHAIGPCFCTTDFGDTAGTPPAHGSICLDANTDNDCQSTLNNQNPQQTQYTKCVLQTDANACVAAKNDWDVKNAASIADNAKGAKNGATDSGFHIIDATFSSCGADGSIVGGTCGDVGIFVQLLFKLSDWVFGIIGALALLMFIYGGFMFILSQGNAERVQQGKGIILAAVIGLVIAFGGYVLVKFVAQSIGVDPTYILK